MNTLKSKVHISIALALATASVTTSTNAGNIAAMAAAAAAAQAKKAAKINFTPITVSQGADKARNRATTSIKMGGQSRTIGYHALLRTNQELPRLGGKTGEKEHFGLLKLANGSPLLQDDGSPWICTNDSGPDHTSLIKHGNALFAVTHLECALGGAYVTKLQQAGNGELTPLATRSVDFSKVFGTYVNCAGSKTSWNTFLGSEEYEPPMAKLDPTAANGAWFKDPSWHDLHMAIIAEYNGLPNNAEHAKTSGYYYGWTPEITITSENGDTKVDKHFAMGRFAHELAYVMPDQRTVYLSDDGTNVGLFLFVADRAKDLSSGILYATKWHQTSAEGVGAANLTWINLGHASNVDVRAALDAKVTFNDMWEVAAPADAAKGTCPTGFTSTNTYDVGFLCVKLKAGAEKRASRLETRLYAAYLGATTEFRKEEGLTYNPDHNILYIGMSEVAKGMEDGSSSDKGGPNHIRLKANKCGAVYGSHLKAFVLDNNKQPIDSAFVAVDMYGVVAGAEKDYNGTEFAGNSCDLDKIANPDNVSYLPVYGALLIGEDTDKHQNDVLWSYDVKTARLDRIASTPYGAETTSPYWFPNIGGYGYITMVTQHPYGESDADLAENPSDKESYIGYIGPLPRLD